jgi:hypothetical protein
MTCIDAGAIVADDIAIGCDGQGATAVVAGNNADIAAGNSGASAGGDVEIGARARVPRRDAGATGAGDIAVGDDGHRWATAFSLSRGGFADLLWGAQASPT